MANHQWIAGSTRASSTRTPGNSPRSTPGNDNEGNIQNKAGIARHDTGCEQFASGFCPEITSPRILTTTCSSGILLPLASSASFAI